MHRNIIEVYSPGNPDFSFLAAVYSNLLTANDFRIRYNTVNIFTIEDPSFDGTITYSANQKHINIAICFDFASYCVMDIYEKKGVINSVIINALEIGIEKGAFEFSRDQVLKLSTEVKSNNYTYIFPVFKKECKGKEVTAEILYTPCLDKYIYSVNFKNVVTGTDICRIEVFNGKTNLLYIDYIFHRMEFKQDSIFIIYNNSFESYFECDYLKCTCEIKYNSQYRSVPEIQNNLKMWHYNTDLSDINFNDIPFVG